MAHALATKTRISVALSVRRFTVTIEGCRIRRIRVYCMGRRAGPRCYHSAELRLDDLPDWDWYDICAHLKCSEWGSIGWVDPRPNEAI
jgi:hypothetical protein